MIGELPPLVPQRARPAWAALALAAVLCWPLAARAASASCKVALAGTRALVALTLEGLLDRDLLRLVRLGLSGRLSIEVSVLRRRFLFSSAVARATVDLELRWSEPAGLLLLDGRPVRDPDRLTLERVALELPEGLDPEGLEVEARSELQVVTAQSLGDVARWIAGGSGAERSALARNLIGAVADDLTRSADAKCKPRQVGGR